MESLGVDMNELQTEGKVAEGDDNEKKEKNSRKTKSRCANWYL